MRVLIIGAGGHGQVVADTLLAGLEQNGASLQPIGFLDDDPSLHGRVYLGLPVLGAVARLAEIEHEAVIVAIGSNRTRRQICRRLAARGERFATAIHPSAIIGSAVEIGPGTMICAGVIVNTGTRIGPHVILNTGCSVDHHNCLGDDAHIAPGVHLGGDVTVGEGALIGIGATVLPQRRVGDWAVVGAGAVVTRDVPGGTIVAGIPARTIKAAVPVPVHKKRIFEV